MSAWSGELNEEMGKSAAMRLLLHYAGDVHQPLHAESRVNWEYVSGDRGGNSFYLPSKDGASNLHGVFDSVFYTMAGYPVLPMPDSDWNTQGSKAQSLMSAHPESSLSDTKNLSFQSWADSSFSVVQRFAYKDINHHEKQVLPEDYVA